MRKRWRKQKARVDALIEKWVTPLGLRWWRRVDFLFYANKRECRRIFERGDSQARMSAEVDWRYLEATIQVNLRAVETMDDSALEMDVLHELLHLHLDEAPEGIDHIERVCTRLAQAFVWVRDKYESKCE